MSNDHLLNRRYRLLEHISTGGMAVVFKAQDLSLGRNVAVKILRKDLTHDHEFLTRFQQEARSAANLMHPNIVTVHDFGADGMRYYIVMEYIDGSELKTQIRQKAPYQLNEAIDHMIQICSGVGYAHRAGIVHCDLKPQNVLITSEGRMKVTDFGIARALSTIKPGEKHDVVWGSPQYFSPEQAAGEAPSAASDVYSLGVIFFELLTGRLPFQAQNPQDLAVMHLRDKPPSVRSINPNVPEAVERIVTKLLSKESGQRYRSADQLGHILRAYRKHGNEATNVYPSARVPAKPPTGATTARQPQAAAPSRPSSGTLPPRTNPLPPKGVTATGPRTNPLHPPRRQTASIGSSTGATGAASQRVVPRRAPSRTGPTGSTRRYPDQSQPIAEVSDDVDWMYYVLVGVALISVLGLIPLWTMVYFAYRNPFAPAGVIEPIGAVLQMAFSLLSWL